jgi:hypothetical protein
MPVAERTQHYQSIHILYLYTTFACMLFSHVQVFASGTGNRRHPLFFLAAPRRWFCRKLGVTIPEDDAAVDSSDLAAVTAANPLPPHSSSKGAATSRFLSPRGGRPSSNMQLPIRSPTPVAGAGAGAAGGSSSGAPLMGSSPSKAAAGMLDGTGAVPDSSTDASASAAAAADVAGSSGFSEPEDVAAERLRVEGLTDLESNPIVVRQLNKTYPGQDGQPPKVGCSAVLCCGGSLMPLLSNSLAACIHCSAWCHIAFTLQLQL